MAISSDGELLVSDHFDGTVRRWSASTGESLGQPLGCHNDRINDVAVSENGNRIVSCPEDGDVRLQDALSGEGIGIPLRVYGGRVICIAVSRDGKLVMSGSRDENVRHWDVSAERNGSGDHRLLTSPDEYHFDPF